MTPAPLTGFIIHSRPYQEKRAIYSFFCQDKGLIDGVGTKGLPLFVEMQLLVGGKSSLKNLKEPQFVTGVPSFALLKKPSLQYAALYLNEVLYRLLAKEDPQPDLWQVYKKSLHALENADELAMRQVLRWFEYAFFSHLGVLPELLVDSLGESLTSATFYRYVPEEGLMAVVLSAVPRSEQGACLLGEHLTQMASAYEAWASDDEAVLTTECLTAMGILHRQVMDYLLDYKPLHSRKLWQDQMRLARA